MELEHHGLKAEMSQDKTLQKALTEPTAGVTLIRLGYWWRIVARMENRDAMLPVAQVMKDAQVVIESQRNLIAQQSSIIETLRADLKRCEEELCDWTTEEEGDCS